MVKLGQGSTYTSVTDLFPHYVSPLVSQQMKLGPLRVIHLCQLPRTFLVKPHVSGNPTVLDK